MPYIIAASERDGVEFIYVYTKELHTLLTGWRRSKLGLTEGYAALTCALGKLKPAVPAERDAAVMLCEEVIKLLREDR